jgi:uncharacterized protein YxjI
VSVSRQFEPQTTSFLRRPAVIIGRQIEMLNIFLGYEQANRYAMYDAYSASPLGFILEEGTGLGASIMRQLLGTHRSVNATIMGLDGQVLLKLRRPFQLINSRLYVESATGETVGEVHQRWHLWRRRYDLFIGRRQFAMIDAPFLSWDFIMWDSTGSPIASVNKNFIGFGREIFTDTSQYVIRMADVARSMPNHEHLTDSKLKLSDEERAVVVAAALSIDFDYFSRHSGHGGIGFPFFFFPFWGGNDD